MSGHLIIEMRIFDALQFCNSQEQPHSQPMASPEPLLKGSPVVSRPALSPPLLQRPVTEETQVLPLHVLQVSFSKGVLFSGDL